MTTLQQFKAKAPIVSTCFLWTFLASSCGAKLQSNDPSRVTNKLSCAMPADQGSGSFVGAWGSLPISLVFDNDFYATNGGSAVPSLKAAAQSWNSWGALKGLQPFRLLNDVSGTSGGMAIPNVTTCDQTSYTSALGNGFVGVWKIGTAGAHANLRSCGRVLASGIQGQTEWILTGGKISSASILLNFENFNTPGMPSIDVESLLLHETGHVLGLLHSCNGSSGSSSDSTSAVSCNSAPAQYQNAVMFPYLSAGQNRRSLTQNDFSRINCLY